MAPAAINRPMRTVEKKKRTGCRSMKTLKRKAKMKKNRKVYWKKLILPNMELDDDDTSQTDRKQPQTKRLTGKKQRKLRKRMMRLIKAQEQKMEDVATAEAEEKSPEDAEKAEEDGEMQEDE